MTQEMAIRGNQSIMLNPADVVANATIQAKLLMDIVEKTHCFQLIAKKKYLQVEAWETIGAFNRVHAVTESVIPIKRDDLVVGYDAKVNLVNQDGIVVGSAIMPCYFTENACKGKESDAKDKACKSAAQTFATSKAYRMNFSYVAILAGYEPTPAEEITGEDTLGGVKPDEKQEHWCEEHQEKFFKAGKMKGYAHKLPDGSWHNEPEPATPPAPPTSGGAGGNPPVVVPTTTEGNAESGEGQKVARYDLEWVEETLGIIKWKTAWLGWVNSQFHTKHQGKTADILDALNDVQLKAFIDKIQTMRESAGQQ